MKHSYSATAARKSAQKSSHAYGTISTGLMAALVLFPIPVIFFVVFGNYSPKSKMYWSLAAALETLATVALSLYTLHSLKDVLAIM